MYTVNTLNIALSALRGPPTPPNYVGTTMPISAYNILIPLLIAMVLGLYNHLTQGPGLAENRARCNDGFDWRWYNVDQERSQLPQVVLLGDLHDSINNPRAILDCLPVIV